jgi:ribosomal protein S18 acetylase RimI-like enzyme
MQRRTVQRDGEIVVVESRHANGQTSAVVLPQAGSAPLTSGFVASATGVARQLFGSAVTVASPALTDDESVAFRDAGYTVRTSLHLLVLNLEGHRGNPPPGTTTTPTRSTREIRLSTYRPLDEPAVLATDLAAFGAGAEMDHFELASAFRATPHSRLRVARVDGEIVGFALFGRADRRGYLQRLAVAPVGQGQGVGRLLVLDGLRWCRRPRLRHVQRVVVNTEHGNARALSLYESIGFAMSPMGLQIMEHRVPNLASQAAGQT